MKIRWYDRVLLFIVSIFLLVCAALFVVTPLFGHVSANIALRINNLPHDQPGSWLLIGGGAASLVLSIYLACVSFARKKAPRRSSVVVRQSEVGSVEITLDAIDTLVQKCARGFSELKDCFTRITATEFGDLIIAVRLHIMPDANIPELTARMQSEIKAYVEAISGITVREIRVMVESTGVVPGARVQ